MKKINYLIFMIATIISCAGERKECRIDLKSLDQQVHQIIGLSLMDDVNGLLDSFPEKMKLDAFMNRVVNNNGVGTIGIERFYQVKSAKYMFDTLNYLEKDSLSDLLMKSVLSTLPSAGTCPVIDSLKVKYAPCFSHYMASTFDWFVFEMNKEGMYQKEELAYFVFLRYVLMKVHRKLAVSEFAQNSLRTNSIV